MAEKRYEFRYTAGDVASAQRMRMLRSKQTKALVAVWVLSTLFLAAPMLLPQLFPNNPVNNWTLVIEIALIYLVTMAVLIFVTPYLDFAFRRFWRLPLQYQFNDRQMRLSVVKGKSKGLRLEWKEILRAEENDRVIILYYGAGGKFVILPKSMFDERGLEQMHGLLQRLNRPAPALADASAASPRSSTMADEPFEEELEEEEAPEPDGEVEQAEPEESPGADQPGKKARRRR